MLLNQYLYNRALIKQRLKKQKEELNVLSPRSTFDGLSINLQSELSDEKKPDEFKKVVIEDKKDKNKEKVDEDTEEKEVEKEVEEEVEDDFDDLELVQDEVDDDLEEDLEEDFELVQDEENDDLVQENKLLEGGFNNDSEKNKNDKNVKNVVLSFF